MDQAWAYVVAAFTAMMLVASGMAIAAGGEESAGSAVASRSEVGAPIETATEVSSSLPPTTTTSLIAVPDVAGQSLSDARNALVSAGLDWSQVDGLAAMWEQVDTVIAQDMLTGTIVESGTVVVMTVARRPEPTVLARPEILDWSSVAWLDTVREEPGRCSTAVRDGNGVRFDAVDCLAPHDFEFVSSLDLSGSSDFEAAKVAVRDLCKAAVLQYLALPPTATTRISSWHIWPDWENGDRSGQCLLGAPQAGVNQIVGGAFWSLW